MKNNFIHIVIENLKSGSTLGFYQFMFRNFVEVEDLAYQDWLLILEKIKNSPIALYTFLPFMYKFIGIDLLKRFDSLEGVSIETRNYIKDSLEGEHNFLGLSAIDLSLLRKQGGLIKKLVNLNSKLQKEGTIYVQKVLYTGSEPPILIDLKALQ